MTTFSRKITNCETYFTGSDAAGKIWDQPTPHLMRPQQCLQKQYYMTRAEGECIPLYTVDRCRAVYCRPLYTAVELYTSAKGAGQCVSVVYRYTAGIHRVFSTAQNTAFYSIWLCGHRGDDRWA